MILLTHSLLGPFHGEAVVVGVGFNPVLVLAGALTEHLAMSYAQRQPHFHEFPQATRKAHD